MTKESPPITAAETAATPKRAGRLTPCILEGSGAEGGEPVAGLVAGDDHPRRGGRDRGQVSLGEADGEWE
jgi:hypothetical protein